MFLWCFFVICPLHLSCSDSSEHLICNPQRVRAACVRRPSNEEEKKGTETGVVPYKQWNCPVLLLILALHRRELGTDITRAIRQFNRRLGSTFQGHCSLNSRAASNWGGGARTNSRIEDLLVGKREEYSPSCCFCRCSRCVGWFLSLARRAAFLRGAVSGGAEREERSAEPRQSADVSCEGARSAQSWNTGSSDFISQPSTRHNSTIPLTNQIRSDLSVTSESSVGDCKLESTWKWGGWPLA